MLRFLDFLREFRFADLHPHKGRWQQIATDVLTRAQHDPDPNNIDAELFDLLSKTYSYIGGYVDFKSPSDIPANHTLWYAVDIDGDAVPDAVEFAKSTPHGVKWTGAATNGTSTAKSEFLSDFINKLNTPGNFAEVSDALMHILITRYHVAYVDNKEEVENVIGKTVTWLGPHPDGKYPGYNGFYVRILGGQPHMKLLLGKPN